MSGNLLLPSERALPAGGQGVRLALSLSRAKQMNLVWLRFAAILNPTPDVQWSEVVDRINASTPNRNPLNRLFRLRSVLVGTVRDDWQRLGAAANESTTTAAQGWDEPGSPRVAAVASVIAPTQHASLSGQGKRRGR